MPPPPGLVDAKPITEVNLSYIGNTSHHNINHTLNHLNHFVDKVKEEYKMVKKLGSGGFASVFLLSNQVQLSFRRRSTQICKIFRLTEYLI